MYTVCSCCPSVTAGGELCVILSNRLYMFLGWPGCLLLTWLLPSRLVACSVNFSLPDVAESTIAAVKRGSVISEEGEWRHTHKPVDKESSLDSGVYRCVCVW